MPILSVMAEEETTSDTRLKLEEANYFFDQMNANLDNPKYFRFNLIAFVSAGRSVTYVMQKQYKKGEDDPFWKWYVPNVREALKNEDVSAIFHNLRNKVLKQKGNLSDDVLTVVSNSVIIRYDIIGSAPENEEEMTKRNSERVSSSSTIYYTTEAQELTKKYVWYIVDIKDKAKENRRYVIESCQQYLQRLRGLVDECERQFGV
jgi:hypothetical protein